MKTSPVVHLMVLIASLGVAANVRADGDAAQQSDLHYQSGQREFNLGHWDQAIGEFEKAYALHNDPVFLFNLAQCHDRKGDAKRAIDLFGSYLDRAPASPYRGAIEERVRTLQKELDRLAATEPAAPSTSGIAPPPAAPSAVNAPAPASPSPAPSAPAPERTSPPAPTGGAADLPQGPPTSAAHQDQPSPVAASAQPVSLAPAPVARRSGDSLRVAGIVCGAAAVASLGAGLVFALQTKSYSDSVQAARVYDPSRADTGRLYERLQWAALGAGGSLALTGALLYGFGVASSSSSTVALLPMPSGAGVFTTGSF